VKYSASKPMPALHMLQWRQVAWESAVMLRENLRGDALTQPRGEVQLRFAARHPWAARSSSLLQQAMVLWRRA
jgi:uncharacterized lipoprotein YmbA